MKKLLSLFTALALVATLVACSNTESDITNNADTTQETETEFEGEISVYTRDTSSGTRAGFMGFIGFDDAKEDDSVLVDGFIIAGNDEIINAVQNDPYAIGYVSLSTFNPNLFKGLSYMGAEPTEENVLNDSYKLARTFKYMIRDDYSVYGADADRYEEISNAYVAYINTLEGKVTIASAKGIVDLTSGDSWDDVKTNFPVCSEDNSDLTVKFGGSDSVEKIARALSPDFSAKCGNFVPEHNHTGSSNAWKGLIGGNSAIDDGLSIHIGFLSRDFKDSEIAETRGVIAADAIVAIVNKNNPTDNITGEDLVNIYSGTVTNWADFQ